MPARNWYRSIDSHVHPLLHAWLHDVCIQTTEFLVAEACQMSESRRWQSLVLQLRRQCSYLACMITQLTMMLAQVIFCLCWGYCICVDTCMCDCTFLRAWTGKSESKVAVLHWIKIVGMFWLSLSTVEYVLLGAWLIIPKWTHEHVPVHASDCPPSTENPVVLIMCDVSCLSSCYLYNSTHLINILCYLCHLSLGW